MNLLFPCVGKSNFFENYYFPRLLIEINGETVIQMVIKNYHNIYNCNKIFVFNEKDCTKFHLDDVVTILDKSSKVIPVRNETKGALCTCLLAIDLINNDDELIIANSDQIINIDIMNAIQSFRDNNSDCGVICFDSIHPRWSYVKEDNNVVVECSEKRPISRNAIAGFYYYKKGSFFVDAAMKSIVKKTELNGNYYISSTINEMILMQKNVKINRIDNSNYYSFYSPEMIKQYEMEQK